MTCLKSILSENEENRFQSLELEEKKRVYHCSLSMDSFPIYTLLSSLDTKDPLIAIHNALLLNSAAGLPKLSHNRGNTKSPGNIQADVA
jgi:hypothetical protein